MAPAPLPRPWARQLHPAEAAEFAAAHKHCETRRCRKPVAVTTWRYWRPAELGGQALVSEHFVCTEHGTGFARRHHIPVDPAPEVEARRLTAAESAGYAAAGKRCDRLLCQDPPTCVFAQRYAVRGEPRGAEELFCDHHSAVFARRYHAKITPAPDGEGSR